MWVNQAFRFELSPNAAQRRALAQHIGAARFAYNWGLEMALKALEEGRKLPSAPELHKAWNAWKRENAPWWTEVSKCAPQEAFRDLEKALKNWKAKRARFPRFKRKKSLDDNKARLTGTIKVFSRHIQLPRLGRVRSKEPTDKLLKLLEEGKAKILSATVSREADRFYVSLTCEVERPDPKPKEVKGEHDVVGVDLGLSSFAVLSDGTRIEAPKPLAKKLRLLKRRSKQLSRKEKGSNNSKKVALALARLHRKVKNLRRDFLHRLTTCLARTKPVIVVEDLNVQRPFSGLALPVRGRRGVGHLPADAGVQGEVVRGDPHRGPEELPLPPDSAPAADTCTGRCLFPKGSSAAKPVAWRWTGT
jgi:putative transposase